MLSRIAHHVSYCITDWQPEDIFVNLMDVPDDDAAHINMGIRGV
jgi:hypothetical protein